jgi:hypothetical protein
MKRLLALILSLTISMPLLAQRGRGGPGRGPGRSPHQGHYSPGHRAGWRAYPHIGEGFHPRFENGRIYCLYGYFIPVTPAEYAIVMGWNIDEIVVDEAIDYGPGFYYLFNPFTNQMVVVEFF